MADQPRCCTVTRVPVCVGSNRTSTSVLSSAAKFALRQVKTRRDGGCHTVTRPASYTWVPEGVSNDSNKRPPGPGSKRNDPGRRPARRYRRPRRHHESVSCVKTSNATAGDTATTSDTVTRSPAGGPTEGLSL